MRLLATFLLLAACASPPPEAGETVTLQGEVVSVDASELPFDGDVIVVVRNEAGERTVRIPSGEAQCPATDVVPFETLAPGARVGVRGVMNLDGDVTPCAEADHYLRRLGG